MTKTQTLHALYKRESMTAHHCVFPYFYLFLFAMLVSIWIMWSYNICCRVLLKKDSIALAWFECLINTSTSNSAYWMLLCWLDFSSCAKLSTLNIIILGKWKPSKTNNSEMCRWLRNIGLKNLEINTYSLMWRISCFPLALKNLTSKLYLALILYNQYSSKFYIYLFELSASVIQNHKTMETNNLNCDILCI